MVSKPRKDAAPTTPDEADRDRRRDADAVSRTLAGELRAFDELIERFQKRAVAVAYRFLGNIHEAMDVCQEAYVRAFKSLGSLQDPERFGPWLMRIVSNLSLNYRRDRKRHLSLSTGDDESDAADAILAGVPQKEASGEEAMQSAELQQRVSEAIDSLPPKQKQALILFAIEGLPQKEVAEIMECSVELVKWNVFQARKALKQKLSEYL
jgi:RNA polymerase sigma-70 factor (ECF subfamily)